MFVIERRKEILQFMKKKRRINVDELCAEFFISGTTARRDLEVMEREGLIKRTHGGAILVDGSSFEPPFILRSYENLQNKKRISAYAANLVSNGQMIFMDTSSTVFCMPPYMSDFKNITVVSNCIQTVLLLSKNVNQTIYCAGGVIRENSSSLVGTLSKEFFKNFYADITFMSCRGFDVKYGITEASEEEAQLKRMLMEQSRKVILLCDSTKIGKSYSSYLRPANSVSMLITDSSLSLEQKIELEVNGVNTVIV